MDSHDEPRNAQALPSTFKFISAISLGPIAVLILLALGYFVFKDSGVLISSFEVLIYYIAGGLLFVGSLIFSWKILNPFRMVGKYFSSMAAQAESSGEQYRLALLGSNDGVWDYDVGKGMVTVSPHWFSLLGYGEREETFPIKKWQDMVHPEDRDGFMRAIEAHIDKRTPNYSLQYRIQRASGEYMWVEDQGRGLWKSDGKAVRMAGITKDIGNIKRVQDVLESRTQELEDAQIKIVAEAQNARKFQQAVDAATSAVAITDPQGAIIYVNPSWELLNGYKSAEVLGRNLKILKSAKTNPDILKILWEKIIAGFPFHSEEIINRKKDGTEYQVDLTIFPLRDEGKTVFYVSLSEDITLRKEIDRAKTEFVSLASHQLRTPLSAIRWYSEMLLSKYVGELNEKQLQYVKEIYAGNLRMVELVNALLNVSRIDLGTFAIDPEPTNIFEIADSVLTELTPQLTQKKQTVNRIYDQQIGLYNGDPKLLRIILQNFLTNSVKYTPEGGAIEVEISRRDPSLYIRVTDNGYGITKHQQGKIFEKLFRADNVRQKDTEGTGLGMYIVKAIVEGSSGKIWFESEENKGTTFHVTMPIEGMPKQVGTKGLSR